MLLLVASALLGSSAEPVAATQPQAAIPATKPKRICRMEAAVTGSITPKRICVTVPQAAPTAPKDAQIAPADKPQQAGGSSN